MWHRVMSVAMESLDCDDVPSHLRHAIDGYSPLCHVAETSLLNSGDMHRTGAEWAWGASQGEVTWAQKTYRYYNGSYSKNSF